MFYSCNDIKFTIDLINYVQGPWKECLKYVDVGFAKLKRRTVSAIVILRLGRDHRYWTNKNMDICLRGFSVGAWPAWAEALLNSFALSISLRPTLVTKHIVRSLHTSSVKHFKI